MLLLAVKVGFWHVAPKRVLHSCLTRDGGGQVFPVLLIGDETEVFSTIVDGSARLRRPLEYQHHTFQLDRFSTLKPACCPFNLNALLCSMLCDDFPIISHTQCPRYWKRVTIPCQICYPCCPTSAHSYTSKTRKPWFACTSSSRMAPTFQLSNITLSSTNDSIPTRPFFGLQDALNIKYDTPDKDFQFPSVFPDACEQDDDKRNCTTSCLDNKQMFASLDTLHNCVVWPFIYVEDEKDELLPFAADLAKSLGLEKGTEDSALPSKIITSIQRCLLDSCDANDECGLNANKTFPDGGFRKHISANLTGDFHDGLNESLVYFNPCRYINAPATADVAGIGVWDKNSAVQRIC